MSKKHLPQRHFQSEVTLSHGKFPHFVSSARILGVASAPGLANQQIRQPKERVQPCCVLRQSTVGHLLHAEEVLDDPERMFNLGPDSGFGLLNALLQSSNRRIRQGLALARTHGDLPLNLAPLVLLPLLSALVAGITHAKPFFSMQQGMGLGDIADVG